MMEPIYGPRFVWARLVTLAVLLGIHDDGDVEAPLSGGLLCCGPC